MTGLGTPLRTPRARGLAGLARLALAGVLAAAITGCGASASGSAATAPPPVAPGQDTAGPDLAGVQLPDFVMPIIKGAISQPNHRLTPGDVVTTDASVVCAMQTRGVSMPIPPAIQAAVYGEYGYTTPSQQHKHLLNYLVPWQLGGAVDQANIWPAAVRGIGFYEKIQTDRALQELVCQGQLSLMQAQQLEESDWYSAWLRYVVVAGRA